MIIFSDFDDTLIYESDPEKSARNLSAVQKFRAAGNFFCLASGRALSSLERTLPNYKDYFDYVILENGSYCLDKNGENVFKATIDLETAKTITADITDFLKEKETADLVFYFDRLPHETLTSAPTKIRIWLKTVDTTKSLAKYLSEKYRAAAKVYTATGSFTAEIPWITEHYDYLIDIASIDAGKETGLERLLKLKFSNSEKVYTIGDSNNDLEMLSHFEGFAVPNSNAAVFKIVPEDHHVDSVADLIERLTAE